jgi:transcriptional regulator GlxA family with amidase domain
VTLAAQVAGRVGFSRQSSFSRWFAQEFDTSATKWRHTAASGARRPS